MPKPTFFRFFDVFEGPGPCPRPSPGLGIQFPVKNDGFGCVCVELCHFSSFLKPNFQAVIKSGGRRKRLGSPGFLDFGLRGGCASSRLDHGKFSFLCLCPPDVHPLQLISGPCSIEKYPSSRMANRYTRIFDAGGCWQSILALAKVYAISGP